jgi:trk system potassium uptake protein
MFHMPNWKIREFINLRIFDSKKTVLTILRGLSLLISILALGGIVYFHGFPKDEQSLRIYWLIINISFSFYVLKFLIRLFYDFRPDNFLKENSFEAIIMLLIVIEGIGQFIFQVDLVTLMFNLFGLGEFAFISNLFVQLYFFLIVGLEAGRASQWLTRSNISPQAMLALSFLILIFSGAFLLMLPEMTVNVKIRFIDALFTSASASCVTGLTIVDTATFFTIKAKVIIMLLIQMGGLNILSFATFFATFYKTSASIKYKSLVKDFLSTEKISDTRSLLRQIFLFSIIFELIGALILFFAWNPGSAMETGERSFNALFHSVSAFNNAGFSLFPNNLYEGIIRNAYLFHIIIALLIFFGGIGFMNMTYFGIYIKERIVKKQKWIHLNVGTRIALYTSLSLILAGMAIFLILEWDHSMHGYSTFQKMVAGFFQSVTTRTAGFNTVDISMLKAPVLIFFIFLMYIGASPGSTGGGIKTTTFALIFKSALATIRGETHVVFFRRTISYNTIGRAYSIALFSLTTIFISTFLLSITEPDKAFLSLLFEEFSAIGTVGLSTGITPNLSDAGKLIITLSMFVGRIGTLSIALLLARRVISTSFEYAETGVVVG